MEAINPDNFLQYQFVDPNSEHTCIACEDGCGIVAGGSLNTQCLHVDFKPLKQVKR